jgi:flagellar basal-body rod modification protein FlgD
MSVTLDSNLFLSNQNDVKTTTKTLGKDDFLKILLTQLQNQDPANPMEDREFISQMATFSTLEQMTNLNKTMDSLVKVQERNSIISFTQLIGKEIDWEKQGEDSELSTGKGIVSSLKLDGENPMILLEDGTELKMNEVKTINEQQMSEHQISSASALLGKKVTWFSDENQTTLLENVVSSATFKDGKVSFLLDNNETIIPKQIFQIST